MNILSFSFFLFVLLLLILYYIIPRKYRWIILLLGSIYFYFLSSKWGILYLLFSTIIIYFTSLKIDQYNKKINLLKEENIEETKKNDLKEKYKNNKKKIVILGIICNILCIVLTKYFTFFIQNINYVLNIANLEIPYLKILIPIGISYYTLEAISYIVDVYRGKIEASKNIGKVALYLLYFPKIIEGPISRFKDLSAYFFEENTLKISNFLIGFDFIIYGLFKKMVIADRAGIFVNQVFNGTTGGYTSIIAMLLYTIQIYAEFSGIIDIVRGVSYLFGIKLPINFKRPFFSKTIQEFWQRWHISLGAWIKEYVFYPVSLSKMNTKVGKWCREKLKPYFAKFIIVAFPLFFVWIVNGIWHGASYKYIVYGMYYYIFMMLGLLIKPFTDKLLKKYNWNNFLLNSLRIIRTCFFVIIGMTLFRATTISSFFNIIGSIFKPSKGILNHGLVLCDFIILIITNLFVLLVSILEEKEKINLEEGFTKKPIIRALVYSILLCSIVIFGIYGEGYDAANFIYGAF